MSADSKDNLGPMDKKVRREAADWLARREADGFSASDHAAFAEWCADPQRVAAFSEMDAAWRSLDRLAALAHPDRPADPDLFRPVRRRPTWLRSPALAAAACVGILLSLAIWQRAPLQRTPRAAASVAELAAAGSLRRLSDGSIVELRNGAELTEEFSALHRRVRFLGGEAFFSVEKDEDRPFVVLAGNVAIQAVGTAFSVRLDSAAVAVLVTEGKVEVGTTAVKNGGSDEKLPALIAGQRLVIPQLIAREAGAATLENVSEIDIAGALAWQSRDLVFDSARLDDIVARFNRNAVGKGGLRLSIEDNAIAEIKISGRIRTDKVDDFVEALEEGFGIRAVRKNADRIVLSR